MPTIKVYGPNPRLMREALRKTQKKVLKRIVKGVVARAQLEIVRLPRLDRKGKPELERKTEERCLNRAKARGWLSRKLNGLGFRAWPDRLMIPSATLPRSVIAGPVIAPPFWIEFKRWGEDLSPDQARLQKDLKARGCEVVTVWCDYDFDEALRQYAERYL